MTGVESINEEARQAARDAVVREHHEMFRAAQRAFGVEPVAIEDVSDRTRRIKHQQLDPLADAALAAAIPLLREQFASRICGVVTTYKGEPIACGLPTGHWPGPHSWAVLPTTAERSND